MVDTRKTAVVTGASRGIGAGLVAAFLKRGYNLVANSRHITKGNPFAASPNLALVDGGPVMPAMVYKNLTDDDLKAIFAFLRTTKPVKHRVDNSEPPTECKVCNQKHGAGNENK